jgi:hypothetical protein
MPEVAEQLIVAIFWSLSKFTCHLSTALRWTEIFWISLPLRRSILPDEDNKIKIL